MICMLLEVFIISVVVLDMIRLVVASILIVIHSCIMDEIIVVGITHWIIKIR